MTERRARRPRVWGTRGELDAWERASGRSTRLTGFSAHYNTSFRQPGGTPPQGLAITGRRLRLAGESNVSVGMRGWSQVVFRRESDGSRHILSIDFLLQHLRAWSGLSPARTWRQKPRSRWRRSASQRRDTR